MTTIQIPHNFNPRPYQLDIFKAFDSGCKRLFLRMCRRSGKDKTCINLMVKAMLERVGIYFYFYPTYSQGRKALWEGIDKDGFRFMDHFPKEIVKKTNMNEMKLELVNGSLLRIVGSDNIDSIVGSNPVGVVFSEFALSDPTAWDFIRPILAENEGWAIFNSTPRGKNHFYKMEQAVANNPDWYVGVVQSLWPDLPHYYPIKNNSIEETTKAIQADRQSGMTEEIIEQEYGVSYSAGQQGAYYADLIQTARKENRIGKFDYDNGKYVDTFWDLGLSDDTAIWFRQMDGNRLVFVDYYEANNEPLSHFIEVLRDKGYRYRTHYVPHDGVQRSIQTAVSHQKMLQDLCANAGISDDVLVADKVSNKQIAITQVRGRFGRYYFNEATTGDGLTKLSLYHRKYDKGKQCFLDSPVHDWTSHAADALTTEALTSEYNEPSLFKKPVTSYLDNSWNPFV